MRKTQGRSSSRRKTSKKKKRGGSVGIELSPGSGGSGSVGGDLGVIPPPPVWRSSEPGSTKVLGNFTSVQPVPLGGGGSKGLVSMDIPLVGQTHTDVMLKEATKKIETLEKELKEAKEAETALQLEALRDVTEANQGRGEMSRLEFKIAEKELVAEGLKGENSGLRKEVAMLREEISRFEAREREFTAEAKRKDFALKQQIESSQKEYARLHGLISEATEATQSSEIDFELQNALLSSRSAEQNYTIARLTDRVAHLEQVEAALVAENTKLHGAGRCSSRSRTPKSVLRNH